MPGGFWNVVTHPVSLVTAGITAAASQVSAIVGPIYSVKDTRSYATCCNELTSQIAAQFCANTAVSSTMRDDFCANLLSKSYLWWLGKGGVILVPILTIGSMYGAAYRITKISREREPLVDHSRERSPLTEKCIKVLTSKPFALASFLALLVSGAGAWVCSDFASHYMYEIGKNCIQGATLNLASWPHTLTNTSLNQRIAYCVIQERNLTAFSISSFVSMGFLPASAVAFGSSFIARAIGQKYCVSDSRVNIENSGVGTDT